MNTIKRSAIKELLVNNQSCENLDLERFKIIKSCYNVFGLVKMEALSKVII